MNNRTGHGNLRMLRPARQRLLSGVEIEDRFSASLWGYLVQYCWVYKLSIEGWLLLFFLCCTIFLNFLKNKDQLLSPDDNSRFAILCKRTTVKRKVSRTSESEVQLCLVYRVFPASKMKTPQSPTQRPIQDELIRGTLSTPGGG